LCGINGLALIRATDCLTSPAASVNASTAHGGLIPVSASIAPLNSSSVVFARPQSVWWIKMISLVPSSRWLIDSDLIMSSVITPPALRITCASPLPRPSSAPTSSRESMQATTTTCLDGRPDAGPV
jgi:hypothetical protein